jgi:Immunoglobulin I-set domain
MNASFLRRIVLAALMLAFPVRAEEPSVNRDGVLVLDNFDGLYFGQFGNMGNPPDISGGVGKTGILQVVNTHAAYFPKTGTESREPLWGIPLSGLSSAFPSSVSTYHPRAWYDATADRFVMTILEIRNTAPKKSWLHLAVSKTGDPRGLPDPMTPGKRLFDPAGWHRYRLDLTKTTGPFSPSSPGGADDPTLSGNGRSIHITVNYREIAAAGGNQPFDGGIAEAAVFIFDKTPLYAGTGSVMDGSAPPVDPPLTYVPASTDGSLQPAIPWQNPNASLFTEFAHFMSLDQDAVDTFIDTYKVHYTTLGPTEYQTAHDDVIIPGPMLQPGGAPALDAHGDRMTSAARFGPGSTMFGAFVGEYDNGPEGNMPTIRLAQIHYYNFDTQIQLTPRDDIFTRGVLPTLAAGPGRLCLAFTRSSGTEKPSIVVKMYDFISGDLTAPITSTLLTSATPYHGTGPAGEDYASWGDYAHASTDPSDRTFWICMPYARGGGENQWGTRWFNLTGTTAGLAEITEQINLTTPADPTPQFGTMLPQGEVGEPVRTIKIAQGQQVFLNVGMKERSPGLPYSGNISWYRDGVLVLSSGFPHLVINSVDLTHQGRYHITASNDIGELTFSEEIYLDVVIPPVATMNTATLRVHPGLSSYLEVIPDPASFSEMDQLTYTWNRTFRPVLLGGKVQPFTHATTAADAIAIDGLWTCTVTNLAGQTQISADVIAGPWAPSAPFVPQNGQVGTTPLQLELEATGSSGSGSPPQTRPDFPGLETQQWHQGITAGVTSVVWRRDGVPITLGGRFTTSNSNGSVWRLHVANPDYEDEGLYDCIVTDAWGAGRAKTTPSELLILHPLAPPYLTLLKSQGPEPRTNSGMVYDSKRKRTVLFGGEAFGVSPRSTFTSPMHFTSNDTWEWDGKVWVKRNPANRPPPTSNFGIAYDSLRGKTVLFGGYKDTPPNYQNGFEVITNDVWEWDGNDWAKITPPTSPPARLNPSMCFDSTRGEVLMIGGGNFNPEPQDTPGYYSVRKTLWAWNGTQWSQRPPLPNGSASPLISGYNAFAFDPLRGTAVLFGLFDDTQYPVWEWNGSTWNRILPPISLRVMESRASGSAFYDPIRRRVGLPILSNNLFPGYNGIPTMLWWDGTSFIKGENATIDEINGTTLTNSEGLPFGQIQDLGVFDTHRRCFVWHDTVGFVNNGPAYTREMHFSAKAKLIHQPLEVVFSNSQNLQIRATSAGLRPLTYQWFKNGILITDNTHYSGSNTATLTLMGTAAADAGVYTLRVTNVLNQIVSEPIHLTFQPDGLGMVVQGSGLILTWPGTTGILETSTTLTGAWTPVPGASSPYSVAMDESRRFWRVRYP